MTALPCALTIAGLDPSGGAGLAADLRSFSKAGAWGCAAATVITVQSTAGLRSVHPLPPEEIRAQVLELFEHQNLRAIKTGALGTAENVRVVTELIAARGDLPAVVDPVLVATRSHDGARLLDAAGLEAIRELCAKATVVTPNITEAEALSGIEIRSIADAAEAARKLVALGARAAVVTGGHLEGDAIDALATASGVTELWAERIPGSAMHGSGCTFAALLAGRLAVRNDGPLDEAGIIEATRWAKGKVTELIGRASFIGDGLRVLGA